jgi:hypothetical protein
MSGYIGQSPVALATQTRDAFTATAAQTSFATSGYTPGYLDVYLNGVKLAAADYTATNNSDVVLTVGAALNDILEVVAYSTFEAFNETFTGTTTVDALVATGTVTAAGADLTGPLTSTGNFTITNGVPKITLSDTDGTNQVGSAQQQGASLLFRSRNDTADGQFLFQGYGGASSTEFMRINSSGNVGIGDVNPSEALSVTGNIAATGTVTATSVSSGALVAGTATYGGTADVITITTGLSLAALTTGMEIRFRASAANTGATTINVDAIGAVAALTITDAALPATYIRTDVDTVIRYNGTNWIADRQIERGSNSNGQYVKWADGTLINTESYGTSNAGTIGSWGTLTFAHAFVSTPTGFGCIVRASTSGNPKPYVYFNTNPSATQYFPLIQDSGIFTTGRFTVTGLWY